MRKKLELVTYYDQTDNTSINIIYEYTQFGAT